MPSASVSRRVSYENEFDLHGNKLVGETHCHKNGFAQKIVFTLRQRELGNGSYVKKLERK